MSENTICIHIFRRDYRLDDNTTLIEACKTHSIILPIFIFTKTQIDKSINPFRSDNSLQFLCYSLKDLDLQLKQVSNNKSQLTIFYADEKNDEYSILDTLIKNIKNVKSVSFNMDYTNYSKIRDEKIKKMCESNNVKCLSLEDICLNPTGSVLNGSGTPYTKFTSFWRAASSKEIRKPINNKYNNYYTSGNTINNNINIILKKLNKNIIKIDDILKPNGLIMGPYNDKLPESGGRRNGLAILHNIKHWNDYIENRDMLTYKTTHLSPFNKFGCVSIREVYWTMMSKLGNKNNVEEGIIRQLFWRDFFYCLSYYNPQIYTEKALSPKYRSLKWATDKTSMDNFKKWCDAKTGYPIVDACMRELNTTGYMHNRGRLIVSNFLCRLLNIDWKLGEKYFATKLYDYDPAQNNFGWQVSGSNTSGTTSRPLEQTIMNPWIQSAKFDNEGKYIKFWCPELENVKASHLHKWNIYYTKYHLDGGDGGDGEGDDGDDNNKLHIKYISPIVDYNIEKEKNLKMYKKYLL